MYWPIKYSPIHIVLISLLLLSEIYASETPETILTVPPNVIQELGIASSLSLNRSNGFAHIHLKMKQIALEFLTNKSISS